MGGFLEPGFEAAKGAASLWSTNEKLKEEHDPLDRAIGNVEGGAAMMEIAGGGMKILSNAGGAAAGMGELGAMGAAAGAVGGVVAAGMSGYKFGQAIDKKYHVSDDLSDRMVGSVDEQIYAHGGMVATNVRGPAGVKFATRVAQERAGELFQKNGKDALWHAQMADYMSHFAH